MKILVLLLLSFASTAALAGLAEPAFLLAARPPANRCGIKIIPQGSQVCFQYPGDHAMICKPSVCDCHVDGSEHGCAVVCNQYPGCHFP